MAVYSSVGVMCDLVVPVHNGLTYVKDCLESILSHTEQGTYRLHVIDDCSDSATANYLRELAGQYQHVHLHRNNANLGFVRSCNLGMQMGTAPYVVLINSDVIVPPGWLSRMVRCAESDPRIASVNPFTNHASNINIPLAPGANFYAMDEVLKQHSPRTYPDVVTGVGFCMLLRRAALEQVGLFDEVFGHGYCEESDLCMRLTTNGWRTVIADDVYVYHKGRASFSDRGERYRRNRAIFDERWKAEYLRQFKAFQEADPLGPARQLFLAKQRWDPIPCMRQTYREMRAAVWNRSFRGVAGAVLRGLRRLPRASKRVATPQYVAKLTRPGRPRITYVLPTLTMAGGVLSVVQLVNELILLGAEARIVAWREYPEIYDWKFLHQPIVFASQKEAEAQFPESDLIVATHWSTAELVARVAKKQGAVPAYFLQDYEAWFYPESDQASRQKVLATYEMIPHKIVKSDWLASMLKQHGCDTTKIRLGMDLATFYPRAVDKPSHPVVMAMARPRTPRRGFPHVIEAMRLVKEQMPEVEVVLFGEDLSSHKIPFEYRHAGLVTNQQRLAEMYSAADVFLDGSDFQGFGRPALEAMACGVACVLTEVGGVTEYARHEENCLLVPPKQPELFAEAMLRLLRDPALRQRLVAGGRKTAQEFCHKREARETLAFFLDLLRQAGKVYEL